MAELPGYILVRSKKRKKTMTLQIRQDGSIVIYAPQSISNREIERFFYEKKKWISTKLDQKKRHGKYIKKGHTFSEGDTFLYLGRSYPILIHEYDGNHPPLQLLFGNFLLRRDRVDDAPALFIKWYKQRAEEEITKRVVFYSRKLNLYPQTVRITNARTRYGSCSSNNGLSFSWRIIMAPYPVIDYVIIHELIHIREKNHSKRFWKALAEILPDYREKRAWLKEKDLSLFI